MHIILAISFLKVRGDIGICAFKEDNIELQSKIFKRGGNKIIANGMEIYQ